MEACDWLRDSVAKLSARDQAAIRLRDIEERTLPEVAAALQRSQSATKTAHFRARKRLAVLLSNAGRQAGSALLEAA
jgi:DNA-directed RNA polymerase specialized sigma24 family protein